MLIFDLEKIGNNLRIFRKKAGFTQEALAEAASIAPRTYAEIERGEASMRIDSFLKICSALQLTPNDVLLMPVENSVDNRELVLEKVNSFSAKELEVISSLLDLLKKAFRNYG